MDPLLISVFALLCAIPIVWWLARRPGATPRAEAPEDRLDTLAAWPPEPTRILRSQERLAFSTLKLALPGYLILAQVPIARFINVPKRNSYAEWMRRLGSQCVDFVVCDVTSQVVAVVEIRPPAEQIADKLRVRLDRLARVLKSASIPIHVWNEERLPTIEAAREKILPHAPAVPASLARKPVPAPALAAIEATAMVEETAMAESPVAAAAEGPAVDPFADTDRDWSQGEIIEVSEPAGSTWFDELEESVSPVLPPPERR
ncbi:MAG: DUF2726 domain-containing protein [Pseudomonadota bacterium]|nr:DUF2726 domain-containing protein [Pseudomonadota bacterium]